MIRETVRNIISSPIYYILLGCLFVGGCVFSIRIQNTDFFSVVGQTLFDRTYFSLFTIPIYMVLGGAVYRIQLKNTNLLQRLTRKQYTWYQLKTLLAVTAILLLSQLLVIMIAVNLFCDVSYGVGTVILTNYFQGFQTNNIVFCFVVVGRIFLFLLLSQIINFVLRMILPKESFATIIMMAFAVLVFFLGSVVTGNSILTFLNITTHLYQLTSRTITIQLILKDLLYYSIFGIITILLLRSQTLQIDILNKEDE